MFPELFQFDYDTDDTKTKRNITWINNIIEYNNNKTTHLKIVIYGLIIAFPIKLCLRVKVEWVW